MNFNIYYIFFINKKHINNIFVIKKMNTIKTKFLGSFNMKYLF